MSARLRSSADGFTLIEIVITITIVAVLGAIALPSYRNALCKMKRAEGKSALLKLMQQQEQIYTQRIAYVAFSARSNDPDSLQFKWFSGDTAATSAYEIEGLPCVGSPITECVELAAHPGTRYVNPTFVDPACGVLRLDSFGRTSADGDGCW